VQQISLHHFLFGRTEIQCGKEVRASKLFKATLNSYFLVKAHNSIVTAAVFAPKPHLFLSLIEDQQKSQTISVSGSCAETIPSSSKRTVQRMDSENSLNLISTHGALSSVHIPNAVDTITIGSTTTAPIIPSSSTKDRQLQGDIIVSADLNGCIKIFANPSRIKTGSSNFFPTEY
jgi:hypothetical protein